MKVYNFAKEHEWIVETSRIRANRLEHQGVSNMHASVKGVPHIEAALSSLVAQQIVQYQGFLHTKKAKEQWAESSLYVHHKPFRLKCILREFVVFDRLCDIDCACTQPADFCRNLPIKDIMCPACDHSLDASKLALHRNQSFSNLK